MTKRVDFTEAVGAWAALGLMGPAEFMAVGADRTGISPDPLPLFFVGLFVQLFYCWWAVAAQGP